jgi:hypothetical protein
MPSCFLKDLIKRLINKKKVPHPGTFFHLSDTASTGTAL